MTDPLLVLSTGRAWDTFTLEALDHLRLGHRVVSSQETAAALQAARILLIGSPVPLGTALRDRLEAWVRSGGVVICCGGAGELAGPAGAGDGQPLDQGRLRVDGRWRWAARFQQPLHAFGGRALIPGDDTRTIARWQDGSAAITRRQLGAGAVIVVGADVWQSVGRIQQGWPVTGPGTPAPDGSAPVGADAILRCDDGLALSFDDDRAMPDGSEPAGRFSSVMPPEGPVPVFTRPQADLWRELVLHLLADEAERVRLPLAWLHYWPAGTPAVGHISHDSDQNQDAHARLSLATFRDAGVHVTWCQCWPGGYSRDIIEQIDAAGHEQAMHYNALDTDDGMVWGRQGFLEQKRWVERLVGRHVTSNKNHYTRWQGWTEFFDWCQEAGITIDESRGPSKHGSVGFPYGTAHVGFPVGPQGGRYDVLELPLHTQDVGFQSHEDVIEVILGQALSQHGVAHFLFHGTNMTRTHRVVEAVHRVVEAGRAHHMPWWTAGRIDRFERARRGVDIVVEPLPDTGFVLHIRAATPVDAAGILVDLPGGGWGAERGGTALPVHEVERHGRPLLEITADLAAGANNITLHPAAG